MYRRSRGEQGYALDAAGCWLAGVLVCCSAESGNKETILNKKQSVEGGPDVQHAVASSLPRGATVEALKYKAFQLARADVGYATDQPNVIVAEITQGSGVAFVSWIVLYKSDGNKWHAFWGAITNDSRRRSEASLRQGGKWFESV